MFGRLTLPNHEPVFLNEGTSIAELELERMEALRSVVSEHDRARLEEDIRLKRAGIAGERKIVFELMNSHYPLVFIHDLRLSHQGTTAQIDFLVVTPYHIVVIETKNLVGDIEIDESGAFVRTLRRRGRDVREGIYSPIAQNARHINLMKAYRLSESDAVTRQVRKLVLDDYYRSLIVLANERSVLSANRAPETVRTQVIRIDQLVERIRTIDAKKSRREFVFTFKEMLDIAERWLASNVPAKIDLAATYELAPQASADQRPTPRTAQPKKTQPKKRQATIPAEASTPTPAPQKTASPTVVADASDTPPTCPVCGAPMVLRTARRGKNKGNQFWGCSTFGTTRCKGIVSVASSRPS